MGKQKVKIRRLNWDVEFYKDLITGNGFKIMEPSGVSIDGVKKKSPGLTKRRQIEYKLFIK